VSWDAFQRDALAELGLVLYEQAPPPLGPADLPMLERLARAAGVEAGRLHAQADIAAASLVLRGDAAAKRALWPRLRAMRRNG